MIKLPSCGLCDTCSTYCSCVHHATAIVQSTVIRPQSFSLHHAVFIKRHRNAASIMQSQSAISIIQPQTCSPHHTTYSTLYSLYHIPSIMQAPQNHAASTKHHHHQVSVMQPPSCYLHHAASYMQPPSFSSRTQLPSCSLHHVASTIQRHMQPTSCNLCRAASIMLPPHAAFTM